ncbi:unnamed protein product, partial [marine sediment metagenome]
KMKITTVTGLNTFITERVKVKTDRGEIIVSRNHPFLVTRITRDGKNWHSSPAKNRFSLSQGISASTSL